MMECREAIEAIWTADPKELEPHGSSELGRHLERCPRCRRRAEVIRAGSEGLDRELERWARARSAGEAVARARERLEAEGAPGPPPAGRESSPGIGRRALVGGVLAAAAALVVLLVQGEPSGPERDAPAERPTVAGSRELPGQHRPGRPILGLDPPPDRTVVVLDTGNPEITIVWFF